MPKLSRLIRGLTISSLTLVALTVLPGAAGAAPVTELVSRADGITGPGATGYSDRASTSADGRYVAFASGADNLSNEDNDNYTNVFVRDTVTGKTALVSRQSATQGGAGANGNSARPSISASGRYVAFESSAANLGATGGFHHIFVRDLVAGTTTLVSRSDGAASPANGPSERPAISASGRYVAFGSRAGNLGANGAWQVFLHDLREQSTTLVSRQDGASGATANSASFDPSISADGRYVAFGSEASNLGASPGTAQVFLRDTIAMKTTLVSRQGGAAGAGGDRESGAASISADGRYVAFESRALNLGAESGAGQIFVRDLRNATTTLISRESGANGTKGDSFSYNPAISASGRYVAFESEASNLGVGPNTSQVFVRDLEQRTTTLISRQSGAQGAKGNDYSYNPAVSASGRYVAFQSDATNLSNADGDGTTDIFLRGPAPYSLGKAKLNSRRGSAKLAAFVRGAGTLKVKRTKLLKPSMVQKKLGGEAPVRIAPTAAAKAKLAAAGNLRVKATVAYKPTGGKAIRRTKQVRLALR